MGHSKGATGPRNSYRVNGVAQCSLLDGWTRAQMTNSPVSRLGLYASVGRSRAPKFLERKLEPGRSRFLQQRAGEVIEQLTARSAVSLHDRDPSHRG